MFVNLFTVTVVFQVIIINNVLCASIRNSTSDNLSTTSTTPKSSIIQHSNANFSLAPRTETITHGTTIKPSDFQNVSLSEKLPPKKVKREKKTSDESTVNAGAAATPNEEFANAIKEKFQQTQNRIQDALNSTKEKIQAQNKKLQLETDVSKPETLAEPEVKATDAPSEVKKDKKEGVNARIADTVSLPTTITPSAAVAAVDEPQKSVGTETITFTKTVDLPIINKPSDKQNVFVVGDKGNATFSRTLNSLSVEAHNIL